MFIGLTAKSGGEFIGNVNLLQRVFTNEEGVVCVVRWNDDGYFEVE